MAINTLLGNFSSQSFGLESCSARNCLTSTTTTYEAQNIAIVEITQTTMARVQYSLRFGKGRRCIWLGSKDNIERGGSLAILIEDGRNDRTTSKRSSC